MVQGQDHRSIPKLPPHDIHFLKFPDNTEKSAEEKVSASKGDVFFNVVYKLATPARNPVRGGAHPEQEPQERQLNMD